MRALLRPGIGSAMAKQKRQQRTPTENWEQLELLFTSREQRAYELIRPVVLFGVPPKARAQETGTAPRTRSCHSQRGIVTNTG